MIDWDRKRNANREALAALKQIQPKIQDTEKDQKLWFCTGSMFIKIPQQKATNIIREGLSNLKPCLGSRKY